MNAFIIQYRIKFLNLTVSQGIGSLLAELSSQLNTGIAPPPVGEVTQKTTGAVRSLFLFSAGCPGPWSGWGYLAIPHASKEA